MDHPAVANLKRTIRRLMKSIAKITQGKEMKLKEKLAKEFLHSRIVPGEPALNCTAEDCYLAGFEKCREMAADILFREINDRTPAAAIIFIKQLGEEEVG